tara:strand:- start:1065 stop:2405 length:1341 start_codon:yes stop_codon:yes gene_type:complete
MASTYLTKTLGGSPTDKNKWTWSAWIKRTGLGSEQILFYADDGGSNYYTNLRFNNQDEINFQNRWNNSNDCYLITTEKYRDVNAWMHIVLVFDTSNATAADRQIIYVNGTRLSNYRTETTSTQNRNASINDGYEHRIGRGNNVQGSAYFQGLMSHVHFSDGYVYAPTVFGETDSTTGQWKIKVDPTFTLGTNGFTILKDGNTVTDQSSNSNNWSVGGGTLTNTQDCPSNVFATLNPLHRGNTLTGFSFANNNNTITFGSTSYPYTFSTLAVSSGKWYAEFKVTANPNDVSIGISNGEKSTYLSHSQYDYAYVGSNGNIQSNQAASPAGYGSALSNNDILGVAMDLDNNKLYFSINGTFQNSGVPTSGSTGTGAKSITAPSSTTNGVYHFAVGDFNSAASSVQCNFGDGFFGTTAISSEGSNASGIGKFEYDVPAGYTALSTKGLNE